MAEASDADARRRAARRAFVKSAHPDRGGDPAAFVRGLAAFDAVTGPARPDRPTVYRSRRPTRVVSRLIRDLRRKRAGLPPRNLH